MFKIHYLFSRNPMVGSKLISWASGLLIKDLENVPSHVAILIDEFLVMESVLNGGVRCVPYSYWKTINEECYKIPCTHEFRSKEEIRVAFESIYGQKYDYPALLFFGWCFIKHYLFNIPFPKDNAWQSDEKFICTEFAGRLSGYNKYGMVTPAKMCSDFLRDCEEHTQ